MALPFVRMVLVIITMCPPCAGADCGDCHRTQLLPDCLCRLGIAVVKRICQGDPGQSLIFCSRNEDLESHQQPERLVAAAMMTAYSIGLADTWACFQAVADVREADAGSGWSVAAVWKWRMEPWTMTATTACSLQDRSPAAAYCSPARAIRVRTARAVRSRRRGLSDVGPGCAGQRARFAAERRRGPVRRSRKREAANTYT
jgi:hypothetical protein